jgi:menaquinone-dependent protoporphyrinogen oxidase
MRVLVVFGSARGGTEGLAEMVGAELRSAGIDSDVLPANKVRGPHGYDAVIVGGALYAFRWHRAARRFARRYAAQLRERPTYFFSSGPLDDSAESRDIPPVKGVQALMDRTGARGHVTFGGRLAPDAKGFPASAMAKKQSGDWRSRDHVRRWTQSVAMQLQADAAQHV